MTEHNHVKKLQAMAARGELSAEPGSVKSVSVAHDDDCAIFDGGYCNCNPDIKVRWTQRATREKEAR